MRAINSTAFAVLVTALTSAVSVAQTRPATPPRPVRSAQPANLDGQPPRPGARRQVSIDQQFGPRGGGPVGNLLRMRQQLELTDDQVKKLEALQTAPMPQMNPADMMRAQADLMDATRGDVNLEMARAAFDKMSRLRTDQQLAHLKVRRDVRNVLTSAQRAKVDAFQQNMQGRMRGEMRGRMRGEMRGRMRGLGPGVQGMGHRGRMIQPGGWPHGPQDGRPLAPPRPPGDTIR